MKKLLILCISFFAMQSVTAQQDSVYVGTNNRPPAGLDNNDTFQWFIGVGAVLNPDFAINDKMRQAGVHRIADVSPAVNFGWTATAGRIWVTADFAVAGQYSDFKGDGYQLLQAPISLRVQYLAIDKQNTALGLGVNLSYVFYDLSIFTTDTQVDLNNLNPATNTGYLRIRNNSFYAGPAVSLELFRQKRYPLKITAGYDFAVTNSKWKSDYGSVTNTVKENGNRGYLQLSIPINGLWK